MFRFITVLVVLILAIISFFPPFKAPAISVVMSTYNREKILPMAIESILNQSFRDFEFIIINDGSTDKTLDVLKKYASVDKRIKIIDNGTNKGLVHSLNIGMDLARGKYIARMDDDDISLPQRFLTQYNYMEENPETDVLGTAWYYESIKPEHIAVSHSSPTTLRIQSYMQVPVLHPTVFMRTSFFNQHKIRYEKEYKSAEDIRLWYQVSLNKGRFATIKIPLLIYTIYSPKYHGYSEDQHKSFMLFIKQSIGQLIPTKMLSLPEDMKQRCLIMYAMIKHKDLAKYHLTEEEVRTDYKQLCGEIPYLQIPVITPNWKEFLVTYEKDKTKICRYKTDICGNLSSLTDSELSINWTNNLNTTYMKKNDGIYYEK